MDMNTSVNSSISVDSGVNDSINSSINSNDSNSSKYDTIELITDIINYIDSKNIYSIHNIASELLKIENVKSKITHYLPSLLFPELLTNSDSMDVNKNESESDSESNSSLSIDDLKKIDLYTNLINQILIFTSDNDIVNIDKIINTENYSHIEFNKELYNFKDYEEYYYSISNKLKKRDKKNNRMLGLINNAKNELNRDIKIYNENKNELEKNIKIYNDNKKRLDSNLLKLDEEQNKMNDDKLMLDKKREQLEKDISELHEKQKKLVDDTSSLCNMKELESELKTKEDELNNYHTYLKERENEINNEYDKIEETKKILQTKKFELDSLYLLQQQQHPTPFDNPPMGRQIQEPLLQNENDINEHYALLYNDEVNPCCSTYVKKCVIL